MLLARLHDPLSFASVAQAGLESGRSIQQAYWEFDQVYNMTNTNRDIHNHVSANLVKPFLEGYNVALFCYGQTGSGKTHTMFGSDHDKKGIIYHAVSQIIKECESQVEAAAPIAPPTCLSPHSKHRGYEGSLHKPVLKLVGHPPSVQFHPAAAWCVVPSRTFGPGRARSNGTAMKRVNRALIHSIV